MPYKFKKGGNITETGAKEISLDLTKDNLIKLLKDIIEGKNTFTHQDFFNWCSKHFIEIYNSDKNSSAFNIDEQTFEVLNDADAQWDLYMVNTYTVDELQKLDLTTVVLPKDYFTNWLEQLFTN